MASDGLTARKTTLPGPGAARVGDYARRSVVAVAPETPVTEAAELFQRYSVSGAPVVGPGGEALGVVSVTDLIALALFGPSLVTARSAPDEDAALIPELPSYRALRVHEIMTPAVWSARSEEPLDVAAERMLQARIHRLVVMDGQRRVEGILSTVDLMRAARDARLEAPIARYATRPVETVEIGTPLASVVRHLLSQQISGVPITDGGWPVGFLSQAEVLAARGRRASTPVEEIASPAMLCFPEGTRLWMAADEALRQAIRRVLVVRRRQVVGILTSVDFARALVDPTVERGA